MQVIHGDIYKSQKSIAIVVSRFNTDVTEKLLAGALAQAKKREVPSDKIIVVHVPGAVEIGFTALCLAKKKCYGAIITLGAIIKGETAHFDYVAQACVQACNSVMLAENIPVIFGVLTTFTREQALERANGISADIGSESLDAALEMMSVAEKISQIQETSYPI